MTACRVIIICAAIVFCELAFVAYGLIHHGIGDLLPLTLFGLACALFVAALWGFPNILPIGRGSQPDMHRRHSAEESDGSA